MRPAKAVDHVVSVRLGGDPLPPLTGLRSLCIPCQTRKTASVDAGKTIQRHVQGFDADGNPLDTSDPWHGSPIDGGRSDHCPTTNARPAAHPRVYLVSNRGKE